MRCPIFAALMLLSVAPVASQEIYGSFSACENLFDGNQVFQRTVASVVTWFGGSCHFTNIVAELANYGRFSIDDVTLTGSRSIDEGLWIGEVSFDGSQFLPEYAGHPLLSYVEATRQDPANLHLAVAWNPVSGDMEIADFSISGKFLGTIAVSATLTGVHELPKDFFDLARLTDLNIKHVTVDFDNRLMFHDYVAEPILSQMAPDEDPRPRIAALQQAINTMIATLPFNRMPATTKVVLSQFVADFPHAFGHYRLEVSPTQKQFPVAALLGMSSVEDLAAVLAQLTIDATYADREGLRRAR